MRFCKEPLPKDKTYPVASPFSGRREGGATDQEWSLPIEDGLQGKMRGLFLHHPKHIVHVKLDVATIMSCICSQSICRDRPIA